MSQNSSIEWTEATWNPVRGCTKVSPGCANCYAETFAERWRGIPGHPYEQGFDLLLVPDKLNEPLFRKKPTMYFVNSMSDLFHEDVPDEFIDRVFAVMALAERHTFQVLTKRAERMRAYFGAARCAEDLLERWGDAALTIEPLGDGENASDEAASRCENVFASDWPLPNVWLGVSVENQHFADQRIPLLLHTPAAVRFISAEPLLGPINLLTMTTDPPNSGLALTDGFGRVDGETDPLLHWVIVGGESGHGARVFDIAWAYDIVTQCHAARVPCFVKQIGSNPRPIKKPKHSKGGEMSEWPESIRVRQFPRSRSDV